MISDKNIIKNGFKNSIGWNRGRNEKSNHLLDPLTSIPIKGTKIKAANAKKNRITDILTMNSWFKNENNNIIKIPTITNIKCFKNQNDVNPIYKPNNSTI